ncbi:MAG: AtpZ/AtpI family protein [Nodosilinea sp.]
MKYSTDDPELSDLSVKAKNSRLSTFLGRIALSIGAAPLSGYLLGRLVEQRWPGELSWSLTLLLLGLVIGVINLGLWMKRDVWGDNAV